MTGLIGRIARGFGASTVSSILHLIIQFAGIPVFLYYWGPVEYGEWIVLITIPAYLSLSDVGFGTVSSNEMIMNVARDNRKDALSIYQTTRALIQVIFVSLFILIAIFLQVFPYDSWLNLRTYSRDEFTLILLLLFIKVYAEQQSGLYQGVFKAESRYPLGIMIGNLIYLIEFILTIIVVSLGGKMLAVAAVYAGNAMAGWIILRLTLNRIAPWLEVGYKSLDRSLLRRMVRPALSMQAFPVSQIILVQGANIVVAVLQGPVVVAIFNTIRTLVNSITRFLDLIAITVWPEISSAYGAGKLDLVRKLHKMGSQMAFWSSLSAIVLLAVFGETIYTYWTAKKITWDYEFYILMLIAAFIGGLQSLSKVILLSTNMHIRIANIYFIASLVTLFVLYIAVRFYGYVAIAYTLIGYHALIVGIIIKEAIKLSDDSAKNYLSYVLSLSSFLRNIYRLLTNRFYISSLGKG